jgi:hypothetical protein
VVAELSSELVSCELSTEERVGVRGFREELVS